MTNFRPDLEVRADVVIVRAAGRKITAPAATLPALRVLISGHPVDLVALADRTGTDATPLATALINAGVCAELTPALADGYEGMIDLGGSPEQEDETADAGLEWTSPR